MRFLLGDIYEIPPKNGHLILADSEMEFECICTPPWEEKHEFTIPKDKIISSAKIEKILSYGKIKKLNNGGKISIEYLKQGQNFQTTVDNNFVEVYYFQKGKGRIIIDEDERKIHEAECFLVNSNSKVVILPDSDLKFSRVKDIIYNI